MTMLETPRRSPTQTRSKETVRAILEASARILVAEGASGLTTNRVARDAGVSIGSLYQYFRSREDLVGALAEAHAAEMLGLLATHAAGVAGKPPREAIAAFVDAMIAAHRGAPELHVALTHQILSQGPAALKAIQDPARVVVRAWLEQHKAEILPKDLDAAAFLLTTTVEAAIHGQIIDDPDKLSDPGWVDEVVALLVRYLGV